MIECGPANESEVVLAFLKPEVDSPRYRDVVQDALEQFGRGSLVDNPVLDDDLCNGIRRMVLHYRGFDTREVFVSRVGSTFRLESDNGRGLPCSFGNRSGGEFPSLRTG